MNKEDQGTNFGSGLGSATWPFTGTAWPYNVKNGDKVQDKITGYEGIAKACTIHSSGRLLVHVQGPLNKDGQVPATEAFDQEDLIVLASAAANQSNQERQQQRRAA